MVLGELERHAFDGRRNDGLDEVADSDLPLPSFGRIGAREAIDDGDECQPVTLEEAEDRRRRARPQGRRCGGLGPGLVQPGCRRSPGRDGRLPGRRRLQGFLAIGGRFARMQAGFVR